MLRTRLALSGLALFSSTLSGCGFAGTEDAGTSPAPVSAPAGVVGDKPVMDHHLDESSILGGTVSVADVLLHGQHLFEASFNTLDGAGRPESLGTGPARARRDIPQNMNRFSAPGTAEIVRVARRQRRKGP